MTCYEGVKLEKGFIVENHGIEVCDLEATLHQTELYRLLEPI